jgi:hypothetical protein
MAAYVNAGDTAVLAAVRTVLLGIVPAGVEVIRAYGNRVPEPLGPDFCVVSPLRRDRLSTNRDVDVDTWVTGGIEGETLVVEQGFTLLPGYSLYGPAVARGSLITAASPEANTYTVAPPQVVPAGSKLYVGRHVMLQPVDAVYQCDVHGPNSSATAIAIQTVWRDEIGCQMLREASGALELQPLYADDPRMVPFTNAEAQWEDRWIVDLHVQANLIVTLGQEFADQVVVGFYPVDLFLIPSVTPH